MGRPYPDRPRLSQGSQGMSLIGLCHQTVSSICLDMALEAATDKAEAFSPRHLAYVISNGLLLLCTSSLLAFYRDYKIFARRYRVAR
jgi:hypothetical protein